MTSVLSALIKSHSFLSSICSAVRLTETSKLVLLPNKTQWYLGNWISLAHVRHFLALLQAAKTWFTRRFRILFECRIAQKLAVIFFVARGLFHRFSSAPCSRISFGCYSLLYIKSMYWVPEKHKWNGFFIAKRVPSSCGAPKSFTFPSSLRPLLSTIMVNRNKHESVFATIWKNYFLDIEGKFHVDWRDILNKNF